MPRLFAGTAASALFCLTLALVAGAAPTRDGLIVFLSSRGTSGATHIWLMNPDGSNQHRLTSNKRSEVRAVFSPNGRQILYAVEGPDPNADREDSFIVSLPGGKPRKVNAPQGINPVRWMPDGKRLLASTGVDWALLTPEGKLLDTIPGMQNDDEDLVPSPDGIHYAFARKGRIFVMRNGGEEVHALTPAGKAVASEPAWSPDGKRLAYTSVSDTASEKASEEIWTMNADGTGKRRLTFNHDYDNTPVWSADGKQIAYTGERPDGTFAIFVRAAVPNGEGRRQLTHTKFDYSPGDFDPDWAPAR